MKRRVILCGAGHSHLHVLRHAADYARRDTELLVVDPGTFWYSGMATGLLGGRYTSEQDCINMAQLVGATGGTLLADRVSRIQPSEQTVHTATGQKLRYDLLSVNIGSHVAPVPGGAGHPNVWPVKPISNLGTLHQSLAHALANGDRPRCLVVGGGSTGSEAAGNLAALFRRHGLEPDVVLLTGAAGLCPQLPERASLRIAERLQQRGVRLRTGPRVDEIHDHHVLTGSGEAIEFDHLVLATGLRANRIPGSCDATGSTAQTPGIEVESTLRSTTDPAMFATGDCARMRGFALPKIGVFGVRQAPVLHHNLLASLDGSPLKEYIPQQRYLSILNLGDSEALAVRGRLWWYGRSSMWLKEWLDRRFVSAYQNIARGSNSAGFRSR